jgi:thioredoxin reductase (NADPH)
MQERVKSLPNLEVLWHTETEEILGEHEVEAVRVVNRQTNERREIPIKGFFVAIGHQPNTDIFKGQLDMDAVGYLQTVPGTTRTNIEGVFAAGDAQDSVYRQAVTAAGTGCMAALDAERFLAAKGLH